MTNKTQLNILWNNTDWSVSNFEFKSQQPAGMNKRIETIQNQRPFRAANEHPASIVEFRPPSRSAKATGLETLLDRARRDAEALAWETGFSTLLLPCLLEEKETEARSYWSHQQEVHARSSDILVQLHQAPNQLAA